MKRFWVIVLLATGLCWRGAVAGPAIPPNDEDLHEVLRQAAQARVVAERCNGADCPALDCQAAEAYLTGLRDTRLYLRVMHYWLRSATLDQMALLRNQANQGRITTDNLARAQEALAWQQALHDFGSTLLDIASIADAFQEVLEDPAKLRSRAPKDVVDNLDALYEALKDLESATTTLAGSRAGREFDQPLGELAPEGLGLEPDFINDAKSHVSDLKHIVDNRRELGDWRKALQEGGGAAALGQIAGRVLKAHSQARIEERKHHIGDLVRDLLASDSTQTSAFEGLQRLQTRRNLAEDALAAVDRLILAEPGQGGYSRCLLKACPSVNLNYVSRLQLPDEVAVDPGIARPAAGQPWGQALRFLNGVLPETLSRWRTAPRVESASRLLLEPEVIEPGGELAVRYAGGACLTRGARLAWAGAGAGQAVPRRREGRIQLIAPAEPGAHRLRLLGGADGVELATAELRVQPANQVSELIFEDRFDDEYGDRSVPRRREFHGGDAGNLIKPMRHWRLLAGNAGVGIFGSSRMFKGGRPLARGDLSLDCGTGPAPRHCRVETRRSFDLAPGDYELRFTLAGWDVYQDSASEPLAANPLSRHGFQVEVWVGDVLRETVETPVGAMFEPRVVRFTVARPTTARIGFARAAYDQGGAKIDDVRLVRVKR